MEDNVAKFIDHVGQHLKENKVDFRLTEKDYVLADGDADILENRCSGFWDETNWVLAVAIGRSQEHWLPILVHEYCHFVQTISGWDFGKYDDCMDALVEYSQGLRHDISPQVASAYAEVIKKAEFDAECKALMLIDVWNLPIDRVGYMQSAYAYMMVYPMVAHTRSWSKRRVYNVPGLYKMIPVGSVLKWEDIPDWRLYEQLFYVYGVFDPPPKPYLTPDLTSEVVP